MTVTLALKIAAVYAALHVFLLMTLGALVVRQRMRSGVGLGDGGNKGLHTAIRVHGNAAEQAPPTFAFLILLPLLGAAPWAVHLFGLATLVARVLHAAGLMQSPGRTLGRQLGMVTTWTAFGIAGIGVIVLALS